MVLLKFERLAIPSRSIMSENSRLLRLAVSCLLQWWHLWSPRPIRAVRIVNLKPVDLFKLRWNAAIQVIEQEHMYENAFNKIERDLRAEEGIANELDYVEQTSWVLFFKYLHDLESERRDRAERGGPSFSTSLQPY